MTKKEYCTTNPVVAVYSRGLDGLEIHGIENGLDNYIYYTHTIGNTTTYHCSKIYTNLNGTSYFMHYGIRISLDECIKLDCI